MQEEVTQKTIALVIKTAKLDASVLKAAMKMYLNHHKQKAQGTHGKTSVKKLVGDGVGVSSIEVTDGNIKSFERVAKKYNVERQDNRTAEISGLFQGQGCRCAVSRYLWCLRNIRCYKGCRRGSTGIQGICLW